MIFGLSPLFRFSLAQNRGNGRTWSGAVKDTSMCPDLQSSSQRAKISCFPHDLTYFQYFFAIAITVAVFFPSTRSPP